MTCCIAKYVGILYSLEKEKHKQIVSYTEYHLGTVAVIF
jgi:hypothetical protein